MLTVHGLFAGYGAVPVLTDVSFDVPDREIVCLIGANGAGKTTTLKAIMGLVRVSAGTIALRDAPIHGVPAAAIVAQGVALVPEGRRIFAHLSVVENLKVGAYTRWDRATLAERVRRTLALFPALAGRERQAGGTLSGGEQQMLSIARALMAEPALLLLDEPSMGLSPLMHQLLAEIIRTIRARGTTVFLVEQNAHLALTLADRGYVMETGRIVLQGTAAALRDDVRVRDAYLGE